MGVLVSCVMNLYSSILSAGIGSSSHIKFKGKYKLNFPLLADPDHKVVDEYGSLGHFGTMTIANRNTFLIDPNGKIVKVWTKVDPSHHSEEVLAALAEQKK